MKEYKPEVLAYLNKPIPLERILPVMNATTFALLSILRIRHKPGGIAKSAARADMA